MITSTTIDTDVILPLLQKVTVFSGFSEEQIRNICKKCSFINAVAGDTIIEEKKPATEILILLKGKVTIVLGLHENPFELVEFGPGNCIGETSVIGIQEHSASVVAKENTTLLVLSRQVLMDIFETDKSLFSLLILNIARELARRLHRTDKIILHYGKHDNQHHPVMTEFEHQGAQ